MEATETVETADVTGWEVAVLDGGPADGMRVKVADRPRVVQVTYPCRADGAPPGVRVEGVYVYRLDHGVTDEPLRYGFDIACP
ncbi:hypothetical protein QFZ22_004809 [Streptomyces canus]|uniref:Lipoprotein n=1 Tax=Streptomyces canus TaxID=58343 RepID=A0AAW8FFJ5_9ACTN|nr:hypothetical protein [Streptomyces canus]MDQ0908824.1 hypothetical protein [Streptomyces canus]